MLPLVLTVAVSVAPSAADKLPPCPAGDAPGALERFTERPARAWLRIDDEGVADLRYRLRLENTTSGPAESTIALVGDPLAPLIVRRARIRGHAAARLDDDVAAAAAFSAWTDALQFGVPAEEVKEGRARSGLLVRDIQGGVAVDVAAACSVRVVEVDVEGVIASVPHDGGRRFLLPEPAEQLHVDVDGAGEIWLDGRATRTATVRRAQNDEADPFVVVDVFRAAEGAPVVHGMVASLRSIPAPGAPPSDPVHEFTLAHVAVDVPRPLSAIPPELRVVFVVDASVSAGDAGVARALQIVDAVLDELPADAGWALVTAARAPTLVVPPWRSPSARHRPAIPLQNGSDIASAVTLARTLARDALPGSGRIIVLSDLQQRSDDHRFAPAVSVTGRGEPLVHVVEFPADVAAASGGASFDRVFAEEDVAAFAAERTGGVYLRLVEDDAADVRVLGRHLLRPVRLDRPRVIVDGVDVDTMTGATAAWRAWGSDGVGAAEGEVSRSGLPAFLGEGGGLRGSWRLAGARAGAVVVGWLWGTPVERALDSAEAWRVLGLGTSTNGLLRGHVGDDEVRAAATSGHFVSTVTSLVDVPLWRPLSVTPGAHARCGCGGCSCGLGSFGHGCGVKRVSDGVPLEDILLDELAAEAAERCGSAVRADVEIGDLEILAVQVQEGGACVEDYVWSARLDLRTTGDGSFEAHAVRTLFAAAPGERRKRSQLDALVIDGEEETPSP